MNKSELINALNLKLSKFPRKEVNERLDFYLESIYDRMEEGMSEEEAVAAVGDPEKIAADIASDIPLSKIVKENVKPSRSLKAWEIVFLILGSPIWLSILIAAFSVILSLYAVMWSLIISIWAIFGSTCALSFALIFSSGVLAVGANPPSGIVTAGAALFLAGASILLFFVCKAATKGMALLTKYIAVSIKKLFVGKER